MALSVKEGNLNITFVPNAKASCVCVSVGWELKEGNWFVLEKLKRGIPCSCPELSHGSEHTSLAYTVYQLVESKMLGDAKAQQATKANAVSCGLQNDEFFICIKTVGTVSAVRKVLSVLEQCLVPAKLFPGYAANIKILNGKPTREEFTYCASNLYKSMQSLSCIVVGKAKFDKTKLALIASAAKKFAGADVKGGTKPESLSRKANDSEFPSIKCKSGMDAILVANFLRNALHEKIRVCNSDVLVYKEKWSPPKSLDKSKVEKWVMAKYGKLADLGSSLVLLAVSYCDINPSEAIAFSKQNVTASSVASAIKAAF